MDRRPLYQLMVSSLDRPRHFPRAGILIGVRSMSQFSYTIFIWCQGCLRDDLWPWYRSPLPWWMVFFLVPIYSICSSLANLQAWDIQLVVMVAFSCCSYAANRATSVILPGRTDIVSAAGAFVIGSLGNVYSRLVRGTAFTSMVTGVLFLVPVRQSSDKRWHIISQFF